MNILFFHTTHGETSEIFEIQTEIILSHLQVGDYVTIVVNYDDILKSQAWNSSFNAKKYIYSIFLEKMLDLFKDYDKQLEVVDYYSICNEIKPSTFSDIEDLKKYSYKGINIGIGVASFLISKYREHKLDTIKYKYHINRDLKLSMKVLDTVEYYHKKMELVYVFNGRVTVYSPVVLFCKKNRIPYKVFEFTNREKYHLVNNATPHNILSRNEEMFYLWKKENVSQQEKVKIAINFFESIRNGQSSAVENFLTNQKDNQKLNLDKSKEIITFFNSSIDEFASVPEWEEYIYLFEDETDAIYKICKHYEKDDSKQFILRIHPNLMFLDNTQTRNLKKLNSLKNLIIYEAESSVYSYQLLDISNKIITFGSTIGVEACYFGKPSICLGKSYYEKLDVVYVPKTLDELYELINKSELPAKPKENSYIYGYWIMTFGEDFIYRGKLYPKNYYSLSITQRIIFLVKKLMTIEMIHKGKVFFQKSFYQKLKMPRYRRNLKRIFFPWKKV